MCGQTKPVLVLLTITFKLLENPLTALSYAMALVSGDISESDISLSYDRKFCDQHTSKIKIFVLKVEHKQTECGMT